MKPKSRGTKRLRDEASNRDISALKRAIGIGYGTSLQLNLQRDEAERQLIEEMGAAAWDAMTYEQQCLARGRRIKANWKAIMERFENAWSVEDDD